MKRTERDGQLLNDIQKVMKQRKEKEDKDEFKKYKVPLIVTPEEMEVLLFEIEKGIIAYFSTEPKIDTVIFNACMGREVNKIFLDFKPYSNWFKEYYVLIHITSKKEQRDFAEDWRCKEICAFLTKISNLWNETHNIFFMHVFKFGIRIEKKE